VTTDMSDFVTYRGAILPWHCDHMGHMNVMWYVGKFDEATWNLFAHIGLTPSYFRGEAFGMAGVQQNITYQRELMAGDVIEIRSRMVEARVRRIQFIHTMRNTETDQIASICDLTAVHMDRRVRKACPFPESVRVAAERLINSNP
jgi:acyl-CoA thioester hydrolase